MIMQKMIVEYNLFGFTSLAFKIISININIKHEIHLYKLYLNNNTKQQKT